MWRFHTHRAHGVDAAVAAARGELDEALSKVPVRGEGPDWYSADYYAPRAIVREQMESLPGSFLLFESMRDDMTVLPGVVLNDPPFIPAKRRATSYRMLAVLGAAIVVVAGLAFAADPLYIAITHATRSLLSAPQG